MHVQRPAPAPTESDAPRMQLLFATLFGMAHAVGCVTAIGTDMKRASASAGLGVTWCGAVDNKADLAKLCELLEGILARQRAKLEKGEV